MRVISRIGRSRVTRERWAENASAISLCLASHFWHRAARSHNSTYDIGTLETHRRCALSASAGVVASDRRDIVIQAKTSHLYFAKMSVMIFSATAFCDAKNR
jgi:hypothetical protein